MVLEQEKVWNKNFQIEYGDYGVESGVRRPRKEHERENWKLEECPVNNQSKPDQGRWAQEL